MTNSSRPRRMAFAAILMAGTALGGLGFVTRGQAVETPAIAGPAVAAPALPNLPSFAPLVSRVRPAVVTITATSRGENSDEGSPFPPNSPQGRQFRGMMGEGAPRPVRALGSGFIVDADGTIVTNNHVVREATSVMVTLDDGRELPARIMGRDARTDIAVLKIDAGAALPWLNLDNSDNAHPGDWVVAVGNPFGLGGSVTAGIVSARGRNIGQGPYDDFIQVDAAINSGNSGGPLFGMDGGVVGVNTAIYSPNGGSVGIGFAIPSNLVRQVVADIRTNGRVDRGWLGAASQPLTPALAGGLGLVGVTGALIDDVQPQSPAERAGLRGGDVITAVNGQAVGDSRGLARAVGGSRPGAAVTLTVRRGSATQELQATLARMEDRAEANAAAGPGTGKPGAQAPQQNGRLGLALAPIDEGARRELRLPQGAEGAMVVGVRPGSVAAEAGLRQGDVITAVGNTQVRGPAAAVEALRGNNGPMALRVLRGGSSLYLAVPAVG